MTFDIWDWLMFGTVAASLVTIAGVWISVPWGQR